jgi:alpha-N-acetylglucosaminidase
MHQADTSATWVMQGWLFYNDRKFWKAPQIKALLDAVPGDRLLVLDLAAEIQPIWKSTDAFYGKPWIWNMLNNFGGNVNLFGHMDDVASKPAQALKDSASGKLTGIGLTMEAIEQNPVLYELMMDNTWQSQPIDLQAWLPTYIRNRYGFDSEKLLQAWQILRQTVYNGLKIRDGAESIITGRPTFDSTTVWTRNQAQLSPSSPPARLGPVHQSRLPRTRLPKHPSHPSPPQTASSTTSPTSPARSSPTTRTSSKKNGSTPSTPKTPPL